MRKSENKWRSVFLIFYIAFIIITGIMMFSWHSGPVNHGTVQMGSASIKQNELIPLSGQWQFYWGRLLTAENFSVGSAPHMDSLIKVPGSWHDGYAGSKVYPDHGVATYRILIKYPSTIRDPALKIQTISSAYRVYANGRFLVEVGKVSSKLSDYKGGYEQQIIALPNDKQEIELIIQVANLNYIRGGIRESPIFGSKQVLEQQKMTMLALQLLFIGSVLIFSVYYFLIFILQRKNITALFFSILCLTTALISLETGEVPIFILSPGFPLSVGVFIMYASSFNQVPALILFVISIYKSDYSKKLFALAMIPNLFFEVLLLTPTGFMGSFNVLHVIVSFFQFVFLIGVLAKAVLRKRDDAVLMLIVIGIMALSITADVQSSFGVGSINVTYMSLFGNIIVIAAMSFIQAKQQAVIYKKLLLYNEDLIEKDKLKNKIMATEMSFLQAQIKPHFLYNALNAIANICEKDGVKASKLIIDLAIYLRGSLEFNNIDKMVKIENELKVTDTYFNIEQARFGEKIQLIKEIEIPLGSQIPVLTLEPLVENAVRHGISKKQGGGKVVIRASQVPLGLAIEVEDDGVGIEPEKLEHLLSEERTNKGVGLFNIHCRLLRLYGSGLDISSEYGCGTRVRFVIPDGRK